MSVVRRFVIVLGVVAAFLAASALAADMNAPAEPNKPKAGLHPPATVKLKGTISVTKDPNNVVTAIKLTTAYKAVYYVTLDKKGEELGSLNGKEADVQCVVTEKGDQKWIKVSGFQPVEKKETTPAKPKRTKK
jgi:hypothetical protein